MHPKELPVAIYEPNRSFAELSVEMDLKAKTLEGLVNFLEDRNINIVTGVIVGNLREGKRILETFIDYTDSGLSIDEITQQIMSLEGVFNVEYVSQLKEGLAVCKLHFPPKVLGEKAVIFRKTILESVIKRLGGLFKTGLDTMLYEAGLETGRVAAKTFKKAFGLEGKALIDFMLGLGLSLGWGKFELVELDEERHMLTLRARELFECEIFREVRGEGPTSYFVKGHILGAAREIFNDEKLTVAETKCIASGDPYCEFQIKPA